MFFFLSRLFPANTLTLPYIDKSSASAENTDGASEEKITDPKLMERKKQYPGLCIADNPNRANKLLKELDLKRDKAVAKVAMDEVCVCLCV